MLKYLFVLFSLNSFAQTQSSFPIEAGHSKASLRITWSEDSLAKAEILSEQGKVLQKLDTSGDWTNLGGASDHTRKNIVLSGDYNFDGHPDILIEGSSGSAGQLFRLFAFDPKKRMFMASEVMDSIWNPQIEGKKIRSSQPGEKTKYYKWSGEKLLESK